MSALQFFQAVASCKAVDLTLTLFKCLALTLKSLAICDRRRGSCEGLELELRARKTGTPARRCSAAELLQDLVEGHHTVDHALAKRLIGADHEGVVLSGYFSLLVTKPIGRFFGSGGVMSARSASKTCLN